MVKLKNILKQTFYVFCINNKLRNLNYIEIKIYFFFFIENGSVNHCRYIKTTFTV